MATRIPKSTISSFIITNLKLQSCANLFTCNFFFMYVCIRGRKSENANIIKKIKVIHRMICPIRSNSFTLPHGARGGEGIPEKNKSKILSDPSFEALFEKVQKIMKKGRLISFLLDYHAQPSCFPRIVLKESFSY